MFNLHIISKTEKSHNMKHLCMTPNVILRFASYNLQAIGYVK